MDLYSLSGNVADFKRTELLDIVAIRPKSIVDRYGEGNGCNLEETTRWYAFKRGPLVFSVFDLRKYRDHGAAYPHGFWASSSLCAICIGSAIPVATADVEEFVEWLVTQTKEIWL
ncbi:MAG: hypothetical protein JWM11_7853 [Planctomycetaceae bacterium]|nr:hypothetical protein [Planctomycetaceae bacterium]